MKGIVRSALIVLLSYLGAVLSAPIFVIVLASLKMGSADGTGVMFIAFLGVYITAIYAAVPSAVVIALMGQYRLRHAIFHVVAGVLVSGAALALFRAYSPGWVMPEALLWTLPLAGAGAGFVYWTIRRLFPWP